MHALLIRFVLVVLIVLGARRATADVGPIDEVLPYDAQHPAAGLWYGTFVADGAPRFMMVRLEHGDAGWTGTATAMAAAVMSAEVEDLEVKEGHVSFTAPGMAASVQVVDGAVSPDGQRLAGDAKVLPKGGEVIETTVELYRTLPTMSRPDAKAYTGSLALPQGVKLDVTVALATTPGGHRIGHMDIPMQSTYGFVLLDVARDGDDLTATLPGPVPAAIALTYGDDERTLTGTLNQAGIVVPLELERNEAYTDAALRRPQNPTKPYPYRTQELVAPHPDGHALAGTLTLPDEATFGPGPYVTAIMVTGSGPQDRDETLLGHKPFLVIADHLTRHGIAVFRYDDRGIGASTGNFGAATSADFATDVEAVIAMLRGLDDVDAHRIGVIGHSEGGLIAPIVAVADPRVAFIVLLAGPGVPGDDLLEVQAALIAEAGGADAEMVAHSREVQHEIFTQMRAIEDHDRLVEVIRPLVREELARVLEVDDASLDAATDQQISTITAPWFRYFLSFDPRPVLAKVRCPILALNGTRDLQVWHEQNLDEIVRVVEAAGGDVTAHRYENFNHLFQECEVGTIDEYSRIETTVDERVLDDIAEWITARIVNASIDGDEP